jgi:uncharacterized membrane protein
MTIVMGVHLGFGIAIGIVFGAACVLGISLLLSAGIMAVRRLRRRRAHQRRVR